MTVEPDGPPVVRTNEERQTLCVFKWAKGTDVETIAHFERVLRESITAYWLPYGLVGVEFDTR